MDHGLEPSALGALAPNLIGPDGNDPAIVFEQFCDVLSPAIISCDSPRFLAFIPAAPTKASLLFDMVVSASSLSGISWLEAAGAVHAENQALRFLADIAGLPPRAGGCFVQGGSAANLSALAVAETPPAAAARRATGPCGSQSGSRPTSISNTLRLLDVQPLLVATAHDRMTGATLRAAFETDRDPDSVFAVAATAGTTNAGLVDDLAGVGAFCAERALWMHVDAAYGGASAARSERARALPRHRASDSLVIDPHKWLFAPFDCGAPLPRTCTRAARPRRSRPTSMSFATTWSGTRATAYQLTRTRSAALVLAARSTDRMRTGTRSSGC